MKHEHLAGASLPPKTIGMHCSVCNNVVESGYAHLCFMDSTPHRFYCEACILEHLDSCTFEGNTVQVKRFIERESQGVVELNK